jgi:hypothetical protein
MELRHTYSWEFLSLLPRKDGQSIFFLDEVGFNVSMRSTRGRALKGQRAIHVVPNLRTRNISICCTMSKCGTFFYKKQIRPFNSESFGEYIDELLGKFEEMGLENVVLIMDNVRFHHSQEVLRKIVEKGHTYRFLPPYSPFLNPIENLFAQWKQLVRDCRPRNENELMDMIDSCFLEITNEHCLGYYRHMLDMILRCLCGEEINEE